MVYAHSAATAHAGAGMAAEHRFPAQYRKGGLGEELAERFDVPEVTEAEEHFKSVLQTITDPELRHAVDAAAGRISRAYQILGFCAGRF